MLNELDQPAFVEVIEKAFNVGVKYVVHLPPQERIRQRIQRIMLAAPRAKTIREAEKVLFVNLIEDGNHRLAGRSYLPGPRLLMDVVVHLLSVCTLFVMASLDTLRDGSGYEDQLTDLRA